jgi:hypothetical protein
MMLRRLVLAVAVVTATCWLGWALADNPGAVGFGNWSPLLRGAGCAAAPATGVTAGSYTSTNLTVDACGRLSAAASGSGGSGGSFEIVGGAANNPGTTDYCQPIGENGTSGTPATCPAAEAAGTNAYIASANRTFGHLSGVTGSGFYCAVVTAPGSGQSLTLTLRIAGASPSNGPVCTISGTNTTASDTTHSATITAGQTYDVQITSTASSASSSVNWAFTGQ